MAIVPKGGFFARTRGLFRLLASFVPSLARRPRQILLAPGPDDFEPVEVDREGEPARERISAHQVCQTSSASCLPGIAADLAARPTNSMTPVDPRRLPEPPRHLHAELVCPIRSPIGRLPC